MAVTYVLLGEQYNTNIQLPLILLWFGFSAWVNNHPRIQERRSPIIRFVIHWVPPIMMFLFFMGQNSFNGITQSPPENTLYLAGTPEKSLEVSVLRNLENGILIYENKSETIQFIEWSNVSKIKRQYKRKYFRGLLSKFIPMIDATYDEMEKPKSLK